MVVRRFADLIYMFHHITAFIKYDTEIPSWRFGEYLFITNWHISNGKIVSDSRFHAMDFGLPALNSSPCWWDLDFGRQSLVRFQIPKSMILDSTGKIFPDSGFNEQNFSDSRIRIPLHGAICSWDYTEDWGQRNLWNLPTPRNKVTAPPSQWQRKQTYNTFLQITSILTLSVLVFVAGCRTGI